MPTMESDWQRRGHPLHDSSPPPTAALPTLPSVAELIASSKPSSGTIAAYHHSSPLPPILCSSTTPSERQYHHQPAHPATQGAPVEGYHGEAAHGQPPISSRRQDSAVAHHRPNTSKDGLSFAPPPEPNASYSHRSPNDARRDPSPALSYSTSSSSAPPSSTCLPATINTSDHVTSPAAHSQPVLDPSPTNLGSLPSDHANIPNTRQQRYNVRFAANYTSANMPSVQRSRPSPPLPATTVPAETPESPRPLPSQQPAPTPSLDRARQAIIGSIMGADRPSRNGSEGRESAVERCSTCHEAWSPPLPTQSERQQTPATSAFDYAMATDKFYAQKAQNEKDADEAFAQWKEKHRHCLQKPANSISNPVSTKSPEKAPLNGHSNKRKSEVPHGDSSKLRRRDFDGHIATAPPVQPSTSS